MRRFVHILLLCLLLLAACRPLSPWEAGHVMVEAERTVHEADSLKALGQPMDDSLRLAAAVSVFARPITRLRHANGYARACYHYGCLLRRCGSYPEAMQAFLSATHSRTTDYVTLGRVYSNMGSMCHLEGDYQLSYAQFEKSASCFLRAGDSTAYCYALNDMAFELAELKQQEESFELLDRILLYRKDSLMMAGVFRTCAIACMNVEQYDSMLYYATLLQLYGSREATDILAKAQAFSYLQQHDSAVIYARQMLEVPHSMENRLNALYILSYDDTSISNDSLLSLTSERSDIQVILGEEQGVYSRAVQLLEQDMHHRPSYWQWLLWTVALVLIAASAVLALYIIRHKRHQLQKEVVVSEQKKNRIEEQLRISLTEQVRLAEQTRHLSAIRSDYQDSIMLQLEKNAMMLRECANPETYLHWKDFDLMCETANHLFFFLPDKLRQIRQLTQVEMKLCILVVIGLSQEQIANTLPYARSSIGKLKNTTARKLGTNGRELRQFLLKVVVDG